MAWVKWNPNPARDRASDCSVRAVAKALDTTWERAYVMIALNGFLMGDVMSINSTWGSVLRQNGFKRFQIPDTCPDCMTVSEFLEENPEGTFVIGTENHVVTAIDGDYYDTFDSGNGIVLFAWYKPDSVKDGET